MAVRENSILITVEFPIPLQLENVALFRFRANNFHKVLYLQGWLGNVSFVSNLVVFCFKECSIDCLFAIQLKQCVIKTAKQEFITFNEPIIYSYLIDVNFFVYTFGFSEAFIKITSQK